MRFLIDMPLSPSLADWLVEQGHDAVHATNIGLALVEDTEIIDRAKEENRTVIVDTVVLPTPPLRLATTIIGMLSFNRS